MADCSLSEFEPRQRSNSLLWWFFYSFAVTTTAATTTTAGTSCDVQYIGDGTCDDANNVEECQWDGGDCCGDNVVIYYCSDCACLDPGAGDSGTTTAGSTTAGNKEDGMQGDYFCLSTC